MSTITKAQDISVKSILGEPELLIEFLQNFIDIEILQDISPEDITDETERFLSILAEQKDGDTIKRINIKGDKPLFVITIIEHESSVNFRAPFKLLYYIAMILDAYEKEANRKTENIGRTKDFKYPPILPIIFYDGAGEWTAAENLSQRTEMSDIFEKYIPHFEYELVCLNDYGVADLTKFENLLSLFMIISKIKTATDFEIMKEVPKEYLQKLDSMNIPSHLKELLVNITTVLLTKANVPKEEIRTITERLDERGISEMILLEDYDVQATRREARTEGQKEGRKEGRAEIIKPTVEFLLSQGKTITEVAAIIKVSEDEITELLPELAS